MDASYLFIGVLLWLSGFFFGLSRRRYANASEIIIFSMSLLFLAVLIFIYKQTH
jgi:hypothetical protein